MTGHAKQGKEWQVRVFRMLQWRVTWSWILWWQHREIQQYNNIGFMDTCYGAIFRLGTCSVIIWYLDVKVGWGCMCISVSHSLESRDASFSILQLPFHLTHTLWEITHIIIVFLCLVHHLLDHWRVLTWEPLRKSLTVVHVILSLSLNAYSWCFQGGSLLCLSLLHSFSRYCLLIF